MAGGLYRQTHKVCRVWHLVKSELGCGALSAIQTLKNQNPADGTGMVGGTGLCVGEDLS